MSGTSRSPWNMSATANLLMTNAEEISDPSKLTNKNLMDFGRRLQRLILATTKANGRFQFHSS